MPRRSRHSGVRPARTLRSRRGPPTSARAGCGSRSSSSTARGRIVTRPKARVWIARGLKQQPFAETTARSEKIGVEGSDPADATGDLRHEPAAAEAGQVLGAGRARRRPEDPGGRNRRGQEADGRARRRRARAGVEDADSRHGDARRSCRRRACRIRSSTAARSPRRWPTRRRSSSSSRRRSTARAARAGRSWTSSARCAASTRRLGRPLHPRRDLQGQRSGQGREPVGDAVEAALRAVGLRRRAGRQGARPVRGHRLGSRARRVRPQASARTSFRRFPAGQTRADGVEAQARARGRPCRAPRQAAARARRGRRRRRQARDARGRRAFRLALEELGTTFVKLGQLLSSRPDLLPDVYIDELGQARRRRAAVPVRGGVAGSSTRISASTPSPGSTSSRSRAPRSPRSTARCCRTGREVVVKVRRPGDRGAGRARPGAAALADLLRRRALRDGAAVQLEALADELEAHLAAELDFVEEAHGSELIARLVAEHEHSSSRM